MRARSTFEVKRPLLYISQRLKNGTAFSVFPKGIKYTNETALAEKNRERRG